MDWLSKLRRTEAEQWFRGSVTNKTGSNPESVAVVANDCYISVFLESLYVGTVRKGFTRFYGTLSSYCSLHYAEGKPIESVVVTTPTNLQNADPKHLDRVVLDGLRLFGPVPYAGGDLQLEVGLFLVPSQNLLAPFLEVVEDIAKLAAQPFAAAAAPFVGPATKALGLLLGDTDGDIELQIGLTKTWATPEVGLFAVARRAFTDDISYDSQQRRLISAGKAIDEPHLVLRIERTTQRDDWQKIPDLLDAYNDLKRAASRRDLAQAKIAVDTFRLRAQFSPDLIPRDATRLADICLDQYKLAFPPVQTSSAPAPVLREFAELDLYG